MPGEQAYVVFRQEFDIKNAKIRIFADTRYLLWINGKYIERDPCRFDPKHPEYEIIPVNKYLVNGENVITVLVHHYTIWPGTNARIMHNQSGLTALLTLSSDNRQNDLVITGPGWMTTKKLTVSWIRRDHIKCKIR